MGIVLLAAFIGVPLLEIAVFIQVGGVIGLWPTLATVVLTAMAGTWCLRVQGLAALDRARAQLDQGALPTRELFDGACLLIAGVLLLTPGFVTDGAGFLLFLPPVREFLRGLMARRLEGRAESAVFVDGRRVDPAAGGRHTGPRGSDRGGDRGGDRGRPRGGPVIEGEFDEVPGPDRPDGRGPEGRP